MSKEPFVLHPPTRAGDLGDVLLVLWHGAGGDIDQPLLVDVAQAFADRGATSARARFVYRVAGRRMPDPMPKCVKSARETIVAIRAELGEKAPERLVLGGRSMGGRAASMLAAEGDPVDGLLFLSYPLHPPKDKTKLRDAHLPKISAPMLFVGGDRDEFCDLTLLRPVLDRLGARATFALFEGADHGFAKVDRRQVSARALEWTETISRSWAKGSGA